MVQHAMDLLRGCDKRYALKSWGLLTHIISSTCCKGWSNHHPDAARSQIASTRVPFYLHRVCETDPRVIGVAVNKDKAADVKYIAIWFSDLFVQEA